MVREWYRKKGFRKNPLHIEPKFKDPFFGHEILLEEISYRIESSNMIFIEGKIGKTSLLLKIIEKYKGKGRVAYVDCEKVKDEPNIRVLLANGKKSLLKRRENLPKNMIILLDNVSNLSESSAEKIKYYFDQGNIQSIIMTGENYAATEIPGSIKHRIGSRVYQLRELTKDENVDIVMERLNFADFFREEFVYMIANQTLNIKELLQECNSALFLMSNEENEEIDSNIIQKLFHEREKNKNGMVS